MKLQKWMLRPWFDAMAVRFVTGRYMPLSRIWAAANVSPDLNALRENLHFESWPCVFSAARAQRAFERLKTFQVTHQQADKDWRDAFFAPDSAAHADLQKLEWQRHKAAHDWMSARRLFYGLLWGRKFAPVRFEMAGPAAMQARHGIRQNRGAAAFPLPETISMSEAASMAESHAIPTAHGLRHWLRFPAAVGQGGRDCAPCWARVDMPKSALTATGDIKTGTPAVVFAHGVAMEVEHWLGVVDPFEHLLKQGVVVIQPEGPGHGRRQEAGWYGGETVIGRGPCGLADYFATHAVELGQLVGWARERFGGAVGLGGISLGALTSSQALGASRHWPRENQPDCALLVVPGRSAAALTFKGELARRLKLVPALHRAGWDEAALAPWHCLLDAPSEIALAGQDVLMLLGRADNVTLYGEGAALVPLWQIPESNVFRYNRGHFSASLGMLPEPQPLLKWAAMLKAKQPL